ncbi:DUF4275 family protein [Bacillus haynesii]|nr:DUF4275 family protein [Bacillus haynesii]
MFYRRKADQAFNNQLKRACFLFYQQSDDAMLKN